MTKLAIELNDASIVVARPDGIVAAEPGCAIKTSKGIEFGKAALQSSRLRPRDTNDRYWIDLGIDLLARPLSKATRPADLAHAQLLQLWKRFGKATDEVLLVVPGSFDRDQLALLLGIADACEMPVAALVDAAVAACDCPYPGWDSVYVEAHLHEIGITRIGPAQCGGVDGAVAEDFESVSPIGVAQLRERWANRIAAAFVAQTRFDPFNNGKSEQRLFDSLPAWLEAFGSLPSATIEFDLTHTTKRIQLAGKDLVAEAAEVYELLAQRVAATRRSDRGLAVGVGSVLAALPGAVDRLSRIEGVRVVELQAGSGALGALACASDLHCKPGQTPLIKSLPWRATAGHLPELDPDGP